MEDDVIRRERKYSQSRNKVPGTVLLLVIVVALCLCGFFIMSGLGTEDEKPADPVTVDVNMENISKADPDPNAGEDPDPVKEPDPEPVKEPEEDTRPVIVIDPGHGGTQPGNVAYLADGSEILEKNITLPMSYKLKADFEEAGYRVILCRDGDVNASLGERAEISNQSDALVFVSIHCNSYTDPDVYGLRVYYETDKEISKELSKTSLKLAQRVSSATASAGIKSRVNVDDFQVLRENKKPSILVETGFMTNPEELLRLLDDEYQTKMMKAICDGVLSYIKNDMPKPAEQ